MTFRLSRTLGVRLAILVALYAVFAVLAPGSRGAPGLYGVLIGLGFVGLVALGVGLTMIAANSTSRSGPWWRSGRCSGRRPRAKGSSRRC
ncbi:hypothetical protein GCM10023215_29680 [Pseudonocardia yuanmonensis]|uniref:Uncharacterized protein n=1 Tax=Pseudonocardia yuanmonensis TaxID=1095914 RepID=A0ABP8WM65_9PSEU